MPSIEAFADTMRRQGFHEHTIQHIDNVAQGYRTGIFAGTNDVVETIGNKTPTSVSEFALRNKEYLVDKQRWGYSDAQAERLAKLYANDAQLRAAKPSAAVALKTSTSSAQVN